MYSPQPVSRYRAVLSALDPRISLSAQLRALFPMIEAEFAAGVPHAAVLEDLAAAGLTVQRSTFAITLYRWRKAQRSAANPSASTVKPASPPAALDAIQGRPHNLQTPGDLRKIRDMQIDLEALRREGLASRTQSSENNPMKRNKP
ncbi:hypothetical protein LKR43_13395 [Pusillimonas sp. MFBS29]|uniref:hypothetical protein n=1 Tax=Pusillimonas sp. MFBS29 TaxID=2886690 RepID=UPI001D1155E2|nr:hypothetical protein [Pusillimonas sp. MFBS29]MCC2597332.1 hypothetical protein [Pusillimonas sp. MFBS29]